jgi:hypothetical protein
LKWEALNENSVRNSTILTGKLIILILANDVQADIPNHGVNNGDRPGRMSTRYCE